MHVLAKVKCYYWYGIRIIRTLTDPKFRQSCFYSSCLLSNTSGHWNWKTTLLILMTVYLPHNGLTTVHTNINIYTHSAHKLSIIIHHEVQYGCIFECGAHWGLSIKLKSNTTPRALTVCDTQSHLLGRNSNQLCKYQNNFICVDGFKCLKFNLLEHD